MKTRIIVGAGLLLTLGTAVAGSLLYGQDRASTVESFDQTAPVATTLEATPEMIAIWKATSLSADYASPKVPI